MLRYIYDKLPPRLRAVAKRLVARSGHTKHPLDFIEARRLVRTKKSWAVVNSKMAKRLELANVQLSGACCMEFGCGIVPTELIYYWSVGARRLIAVDYNRIARFDYLPKVNGFSTALIDYRAPVDFRSVVVGGVDFIHSESVLEHIVPDDIAPILRNLVNSLSPGGKMIHSIDLRDHYDPVNNPYQFLNDLAYDPRTDADTRGNRLRRSEWIGVFDALDGAHTSYHKEMSTLGRFIPEDDDDDRAKFLITVTVRQ